MWKEITNDTFQPITKGDLQEFLSVHGYYIDKFILESIIKI